MTFERESAIATGRIIRDHYVACRTIDEALREAKSRGHTEVGVEIGIGLWRMLTGFHLVLGYDPVKVRSYWNVPLTIDPARGVFATALVNLAI